MAVTQNTYTGNGATVLYSFTFPYLETTDVKVTINGTPTTAYTFANATTIQFNTAPANGAAIRIYRDTDDALLAAIFYPGSAIRSQDLNDNFTQNLYITQEVNNNAVNIDGSNPMVGPLNMNGFQITNLPVPAVDTNAATKKYVDDRFGNLDIPGHTRWRKVATASQTIFSGTGDYGGVLAYSPTREQVYINGALQQRSVDYAADNGTSVVFTAGLTVGDVVDIICVNNLTNSSVSNAGNITYSGQFTGQTARTVAAKLGDVVSVKDFGAVGDGVADDTAAFNAAVATGKKVFVPSGNYSVANIGIVAGMNIEGCGPSTILTVRSNNAGAFTYTSSSMLFYVQIANMRIQAAPGITGARAYKQTDKSINSVFAEFTGVETMTSLEIAYDGFFIFCRWEGCKDGIGGTSPSGQTHHFISSKPAAYGQFNQTNYNQVLNCQTFSCSYPDGCIDIAYGAMWSIRDTDFEGCTCGALTASGIQNLHISDCWLEQLHSTNLIVLKESPSPNPQGVWACEIDNIFVAAAPENTSLVTGNWAQKASFRNVVVALAPAGMVLTTAASAKELLNIVGIGGTNLTTFLGNKKALVDRVEHDTTVVNSPYTYNQNILPIGPTSIGQANLTIAGYTAKTDVASALKGNAVRLTMTNSDNRAYYQIPAKLLEFIKGKTITLVGSGYGDNTSVFQQTYGRFWDSVTPGYSNHAAQSIFWDDNSDKLKSGYISYTVPANSTSLYVGIESGGNNQNKFIYLETLALFLGEIKATFTGL